MKYLYLLGFVIWGLLSFYSFNFTAWVFQYFKDWNIIIKCIVDFLLILILIFGVHKIILSLFLWVDTSNKNFNYITTGFSLIGLITLIISFFNNKQYFINFTKDNTVFNQALNYCFIGAFLLMFFNGFILLPKAIKKRKENI